MAEILDIVVRESGAPEVKRNVDAIGTSAESTERRVDSLNSTLGLLKGAIAAAGIGLGIRQLLEYGEAYQKIIAQIRGVVTSHAQLIQTEQALFQIAQQTRQSFEGTVSLYSTLAKVTGGLNMGSKDLLNVTSLMNKVLTASGTSADDAQGAIKRLSLALSRGTFDARSVTTIMLQFPSLGRAVAQGLGISVGAMMQMAQQGQITARDFFRGMTNASAQIEARFKNMPVTISSAFTVLQNEFLRFIGQLNQAHGVTQLVSQGILYLANHFQTLVEIVGVAGATFLAYRAGLLITAGVAGLMALANGGVVTSFIAVASSAGLATAAMGLLRGVWVAVTALFMLNPFLFILTSLTLVVTAIWAFGNSIKLTSDGSITALGLLSAAWKGVEFAISTVVGWVQHVISWINQTPAALAAMRVAIGVVTAALVLMSGSAVISFLSMLIGLIGMVGTALLTLLLNPIGLAVAGFTAAAIAVAYFTGNLDALIKNAGVVANAITSGIAQSAKQATSELNNMGKAGADSGQQLKTGQELAAPAVDRLTNSLVNQTQAFVKDKVAMDYYTEAVITGAGKIKYVTRQMGEGTQDLTQRYEELSRRAAQTHADLMNDMLAAGDAIKDPIVAGSNAANDALKSISTTASSVSSDVQKTFSSTSGGKGGSATPQIQQYATWSTANVMAGVGNSFERAAEISVSEGKAPPKDYDKLTGISGLFRKYVDSPSKNFGNKAEMVYILSQLSDGAKTYLRNTVVGGWVQGFRYGGSQLVGGSGGPDSQLITMRATPGELVTVETPEQQRRKGKSDDSQRPNINVQMTVVTKDANSFQRSKTQILQQLNGQLAVVNAETR